MYDAPHGITDTSTLASMVAAIQAGETLPPIVVLDNGVTAICGSHRIAAYAAAGKRCPAIVLSTEQCEAVLDHAGAEDWDDFVDFSEICRAIYEAIDNDESLRAALADQI